MTITSRIEHIRDQEGIYSTEFYGEREALGRSDFLRPLLPPEGRKYITLYRVFADDEAVSNHANSCNRKHGGIRVCIRWRYHWGPPIRALSQQEIINLSRRVLAEIQDQHQGRVNTAPAGWPFPVWRAAA